MNNGSSVDNVVKALKGDLDRYSPGEKLPSSRALVERFGVSPVTVSRALAVLAAQGLVRTRPGSGAFRAPVEPRTPNPPDTSWQEVSLSAEQAATAAEHGERTVDASSVLATLAVPAPDVIAMNSGYLYSGLQPERELASALARAGRRPNAWTSPPIEGVEELRAWFARQIGGAVRAADVLITAGGQSALTTALRALTAPGAPVLVESPTYPGMLAVARACGARPVPVPVGVDGLRTDLLEKAFRATGARLLVCQPLFHNPTGTVLSQKGRAEVLHIARSAGAFVLEDDFARHLAHADAAPVPAPLAADDPDGTVVHVRSLTKATSPSLRVAALTARGPVMERLRAIQVVENFFVPRPLQEAAAELVAAPGWGRHLRTVARGLHERRRAMVAALAAEVPELSLARVPVGGLHLWLRLPEGTDDTGLVAAALRAGVAIAPGRFYFPAEAPAPHVRLSFAATAGTTEIAEGVRRLRSALDRY
ncbi:PLP-dependent aminotransferase family protein [Nocardiopsis ansamitocini]|nr:PLP-dependent aminotransferase family protein [Nocardiopsis ansamitocini]